MASRWHSFWSFGATGFTAAARFCVCFTLNGTNDEAERNLRKSRTGENLKLKLIDKETLRPPSRRTLFHKNIKSIGAFKLKTSMARS